MSCALSTDDWTNLHYNGWNLFVILSKLRSMRAMYIFCTTISTMCSCSAACVVSSRAFYLHSWQILHAMQSPVEPLHILYTSNLQPLANITAGQNAYVHVCTYV